MSESSNKPFVITDRRKFTKEGDLRPDASPSETSAAPAPPPPPAAVAAPEPRPTSVPAPPASGPQSLPQSEPQFPSQSQSMSQSDIDAIDEASIPAPTAEQGQQARFAYEQTADRLDVAIRSANPGADHPPAMDFNGLVQSIYLTAIMQLGGGTPEGEKPRVDILGARQSIDMLAVVGDKTRGNLTDVESKLLESALFELRMAFLEITEALTRSARAQAGSQPGSPGGPRPGPVAPRPGGIIL